MYEIIKVGIPLQYRDINTDFLNVIHDIKNNPECIAIATVDYSEIEMRIAPAGNQLLADNLQFRPYNKNLHLNCINTMGSLWGSVRDIPSLVDNILSILENEHKNLKFKKVYFLNGGSPFCGDSATLCLSKRVSDLKFISTKSGREIAYAGIELITPWEEVDYVNLCVRKQQDLRLNPNKVNAFLCLQKWYEYNNIHILNKLFKEIKQYYSDDDIIKIVHIKADTLEIQTLTVNTAELIKEQLYNDHKPVVWLLYKKELQ
jgi:hypothetical protein